MSEWWYKSGNSDECEGGRRRLRMKMIMRCNNLIQSDIQKVPDTQPVSHTEKKRYEDACR